MFIRASLLAFHIFFVNFAIADCTSLLEIDQKPTKDSTKTRAANLLKHSVPIEIPTALPYLKNSHPLLKRAIAFIRAQTPLRSEKPPTVKHSLLAGEILSPYNPRNSPFHRIPKTTWKKIPRHMKKIFNRVSDILFNLENFARWISTLEKELQSRAILSEEFNLEIFTEILKERAEALGWGTIITTDRLITDSHELQREVISRGFPYIDAWAKDHPHGPISHLIQWVYIAESLEAKSKGSAREFFDFITQYEDLIPWVAILDRGAEVYGLNNPGYIWSLVREAFNGAIEGKSIDYFFVEP